MKGNDPKNGTPSETRMPRPVGNINYFWQIKCIVFKLDLQIHGAETIESRDFAYND